MPNYKHLDKIFQSKEYQTRIFYGFDINNLKPITIAINYLFNNIDSSYFHQYYKANNKIGGRPPMDYIILLKLFTLSLYDGLSIRELARQNNKLDSDYSYLAQELHHFPKSTIFSKFLLILDNHIDEIFNLIIEFLKRDLSLNFEDLYCDGTTFEAHNSRYKIVTERNVFKSIKKWTEVLNDQNSSNEQKEIAIKKLEENKKRLDKLRDLKRKSYGKTDEDCILLQDKNKSYIAGYNVQFIEESKYGLVISTYISNKTADNISFLDALDELIKIIIPKTITFDAGYGSPDILIKLKSLSIIPIVKTVKNEHSKSKINRFTFKLSEDEQSLTCSDGRLLRRTPTKRKNVATFKTLDCTNCNYFSICEPVMEGQRIVIDIAEYKLMKEADLIVNSPEGLEKYSHRGNKCESPHGYIKYSLKGKKLKMNGLKRNNTITKLYAVLYNLTRYLTIKLNQ